RTEDLFLRDPHRGRHVSKDSRLVEETLRTGAGGEAMTAGRELRALLLTDLDILHDGLELAFADRRAHLRPRIEAVADAKRLRPGSELLEEAIVHLLVDDHAARSRAALASGPESTPETS